MFEIACVFVVVVFWWWGPLFVVCICVGVGVCACTFVSVLRIWVILYSTKAEANNCSVFHTADMILV